MDAATAQPNPGQPNPGDHLRVSDAERQQVVDALSRHTGEGRLSIDEFEDRSTQALAARTRADLGGVLADLPALPDVDGPATRWAGAYTVVPAPTPMPAPGRSPAPIRSGPRCHGMSGAWRSFAFVSRLMIAIWLMSGLGYFWPVWVIVPWGLTMVLGSRPRRSRQIGSMPPGAS
jgi:hypothetical protein